MFKDFNVVNKPIFRAELYRNRREVIEDITNYITAINYNLNDIDSVEIVVNKFTMRKNEKVINHVYNKIKDKMLLVIHLDNEVSKYIIKEDIRNVDKSKGVKKFTAYSFEKTLENKRIEFYSNGESYPLVSDGEKDGVLDLVSKYSGWNIGYVDDLAKSEYVYSPVVRSQKILTSVTKNKIQPGDLLWEKSVDISLEDDNIPLNVTIQHNNMIIYDSYGSELLNSRDYNVVLDPLYTGMKYIKAYYHSEAGNRYAIKFEITLTDSVVVTQIKEFTNLRELGFRCENVYIKFETGVWEVQAQTKYVWLESIDSDIYKFLADMQDEFNVIFTYDTYNKKINCYSRNNMNDDAPIQLSYDSNILKIDVKSVEDSITALKVKGKDDVSIISVNKYGADIIYNYSYFINNNLISDELKLALANYDVYIKNRQEHWCVLNEKRRVLTNNKTKIECEIKSLGERIKTLNELLSAYIASGSNNENQSNIREEILQLETLFNQNMMLKNTVDDSIFLLEEEMQSVNNSIRREKSGAFSDEDILELNDIDLVESFNNDTAITPESLYNSAEWYLNERTKPTVEFTVSCVDLLKVVRNKNIFNNIIKLGKLFELDEEIANDIGEDKVRLSEFTYNPQDNKIENIKFTNKIFKIDKLKMAQKLQRKSMAMVLDSKAYKSTWKESENTNSFVNNINTKGINTSDFSLKTNELYSLIDSKANDGEITEDSLIPQPLIMARFSADNENIQVEESEEEMAIQTKETVNITEINAESDIEQSRAGMFIKNKNNPNRQLYLGASIIAFSNDGFRTSSISVDDGGIVGKSIYGEILLGKKLYIRSDDEKQTFFIGDMDTDEGFGLSIADEITGQQRVFLGTELVDGVKKARLRLVGRNGEVAISEDGLVNMYCFIYNDDLDSAHPLTFDYPIDGGTFEIRECKLSIYLQKYRMKVKSLTSGGNVNTTSEGGAVVSTTGDGGYNSASTENGGFYTNTYTSTDSIDYGVNVYTSTQSENTNGTHVHEYTYGLPKHGHSVSVNIPNHTHIVTVPNHNHNINIPSHSHELDTTHNHELEAGIFEATLPTDCSLYINDILVESDINENVVLEIKDYLNVGSDNNIKITSNTLGRIQLSIFNKSFVTN